MLFLPLVIRDSYKIMIRIFHTADWHLGQTFFGYDRTEEHGVFLNWLAEEIRQKEIDALIIAGDVFDVSNPSAASQSCLLYTSPSPRDGLLSRMPSSA